MKKIIPGEFFERIVEGYPNDFAEKFMKELLKEFREEFLKKSQVTAQTEWQRTSEHAPMNTEEKLFSQKVLSPGAGIEPIAWCDKKLFDPNRTATRLENENVECAINRLK